MNIRDKFPIYEFNQNLTYLDTAASSLKPKAVIDTIDYYYSHYGVNVHRGVYGLSYEATDLYEQARDKVANFINATHNEVIFTRGATQSLNMVANHFLNLNAGDEIITSELEHHSNFLPWLEVSKHTKAVLKFVELDQRGRLTVEAFKKVLSKKTKVVSLTYVSNVMGYITPIKEIIKLAHEVGALVVVDAAQAAPHMQIDVKDLDCDYLAFSSHKMLGPTGIGVLYGKEHLLNQMEPTEFGGEMVQNVTKENASYKTGPFRFEAGTPIISGAIGLGKAVDFINEIGFEAIHNHTQSLYNYTMKALETIEGVTVYNEDNDIGLITFNIDDVHPHDAATIFDKNGVALRAGHHCAQLITKWLGIQASLRASFYIYNTKADADTFIASVIEVRDFFRRF
ncbi:MAG: cysteine desulfurase [Acholeplasmataceae bacterium]